MDGTKTDDLKLRSVRTKISRERQALPAPTLAMCNGTCITYATGVCAYIVLGAI